MSRIYAVRAAGALAVLVAGGIQGCSFTPMGSSQEQDRVADAGKPYEPLPEERTLPEFPAAPGWQDVLSRALLSNGELEASYFEWKAAFERVGIASAWPNSNLTLGFSYALGPSQMKSFDRTTIAASADTMQNLSFPTKVAQNGKVALDEARASGERFRAMKFDIQRRVLDAWADYTLLAERVRIQAEQLALSRAMLQTAPARVRGGGMQDDLLRADLEYRISEDSLRAAQAELRASRAALNGLLARAPDAALSSPSPMPQPRPVPVDDATLLAAAVQQNPDLAALSRGTEGRADALERARMEWIPDINPFVSFTGGLTQIVGASVVLPTTVRQIQGGIREAEAMLRASEAQLRQTTREKTATFVATLVLLRDAQRQTALFEESIVPATERIVAIVRQRYSAGSATYPDLIDAQRALLESRLVVAQSKAMRDKRLAELEALMGADIETLTAAPAIEPAASPHPEDPARTVSDTGALP